jgi:glutathione S-transferase
MPLRARRQSFGLWPLRKFPLLVDGDRVVTEATTIIEYLALRYPGPVALLPADSLEALEVRNLDRFFDNYVSTPQQRIVYDSLRAGTEHDPRGVADARAMLERTYAWLDRRLADREWAAGSVFSLADCAAAPSLSMPTGRIGSMHRLAT